jgi:hypothetical protein
LASGETASQTKYGLEKATGMSPANVRRHLQVLVKMPIEGDVIPLLAEAFEDLSRQKLAMKYVEVDVDPLSLM